MADAPRAADRPVILTVDDDPQVLQAVARDLRSRYGRDYRIVRADSGESALEAVRELRRREAPLALLLADQRMPRMDGVAFLAEAKTLYPDAKRALLTAYADTDAAIGAINDSRVHYYLLKPWDPPQERLYPVLDDLLDDWRAGWRPAFRGLRLVGDRWSAEGHTLREFLARNQVPFRWLDVERDAEARAVLDSAGAGDDDLPLVLLEDGTVLRRPDPVELARHAGLRTDAESAFYDLVIVGGGPAGLAAAVYGASEGLEVVLLDREAPGGQAGTSSRIENYLGFPNGLSGADLARRATTQARRFGAELITPRDVVALERRDPYKVVRLADGSELSCHALLLATGVSYRRLDTPGIDALTGAGVYYGAATGDAPAFRGEQVHIVGAGNSAGQAALHLAEFCERVTLVVRGDDLGAKMSRYLVDRIDVHPTIDVRLGTVVARAHGERRLEALELAPSSGGDGATERVDSAALFVFIGAAPRTAWLGDAVARDDRGYLYTGPDLSGRLRGWPLERSPYLLETSVPGVFAAGDVRHASVKRVASAVGEGSIAVQFVHRWLAEVGG